MRWVLVLLPLSCASLATLIVWGTKLEESEGGSMLVLEDSGNSGDDLTGNGLEHPQSLTESLLQTSFEPGAAGNRILSKDRSNLKA